MKLKSNIIDPYVGQEAEGKKIKFESVDKIEVEELKVFLFDNKKEYIKITSKEFIAVCPFSGLPDVARLKIEYYPEGGLAIELKSLKYYLVSFKNVGIYQEEVTNRIFKDLKKILKTKKIRISHNPFYMPQGDKKEIDFSKPREKKPYQEDHKG